MIELRNWSAKRSGGRITLTGRANDGLPLKIANVDTIVRGTGDGEPPVVAVDKDGRRIALL